MNNIFISSVHANNSQIMHLIDMVYLKLDGFTQINDGIQNILFKVKLLYSIPFFLITGKNHYTGYQKCVVFNI